MRFLVAAGVGVTAALLLFLLMHALISSEQEFSAADATGGMVDFIRVREDEITQLKERTRPRDPPPPDRPPPPPQIRLSNQSDRPPPVALDIDMPNIAVPVSAGSGPYLGGWSAGDPAAEGDVIPIVRIDPQWPREALLEGKEGWVRVEFTILADGSVTDPEVLESEPPRLFDRNALRAILRWKFKPRIVDGQPVARRAVQRIDFILNQEQPPQ
ncbi:MAG TPA: energy transducer TonB [Gammaproteobacteria bacterium]|nr:energy transducer TonB [Gammaproteobacteria bacterium]